MRYGLSGESYFYRNVVITIQICLCLNSYHFELFPSFILTVPKLGSTKIFLILECENIEPTCLGTKILPSKAGYCSCKFEEVSISEDVELCPVSKGELTFTECCFCAHTALGVLHPLSS